VNDMTRPVYKIEIYHGDALLYSLTDRAFEIRVKEVLTDGVGTFSFAVPTKMNGDYLYNDVAVYDKVKIWLDYDSVPTDPLCVGRIYKIDAPSSIEQGFIRMFEGKNQSEILQRRFKLNKYYNAVQASTIVTEWANDLGLGTGQITADTTPVTMEVRTESYFDLLKAISDYWYNSDTRIQKDFFVDVNNNLVWKSRPLRTTGISSLTIGENIISYLVTRDLVPVKNNITVYGAAEKPLPADKDAWTESITGWTASAGTVALYGPDGQKAGNYAIQGYTGAGAAISTFKRDIPHTTIRDINKLYFWKTVGANCNSCVVRLHAPDSSNYFEASLSTSVGFVFHEFSLGPDAEYDAVKNPNGKWTKVGSPNWWDIEYIEFHTVFGATDRYVAVDGLWFYPERWSATATSAFTYGQNDYEVTDNTLHSDSDCEKRAETLLLQLKNPITRLDIRSVGDANVRIGDRIPITIPAEGLSAVNFDVLSVEYSFSKEDGFFNKQTLISTADTRSAPSANLLEYLQKKFIVQNQIGKGVQVIK